MSYLEDSFVLWLETERMPATVRELRFAPPRQWRFDFAWPHSWVAVEIEGLRGQGGGRHQQKQGFLDDAEKYEFALRLGWRVYRVPGPWVADPKRHIWRPETMATLRVLLHTKDG